MNINELINTGDLKVVTKVFNPETNITGGYTSDLLSDVMANTKKDNIWITLQTHLNITAVASLKEIAAVIVVMDREISKETLDKAIEEKITILTTPLTSFQISGKIYDCGIR
ncbi:MAG: serine kinase [Ignavibacteria bacterium]|nr:serine kinase [Ignavibacteria bacterium]